MSIAATAAIVVLGLLALAAMVVAIAMGASRLLKGGKAEPEVAAEPPPPKLATTIAVALRELQDMARARDDPAGVPWVLALGVPEAQLEPLLPPLAREARDKPRLGWLDRDRLNKEGTLSFRDRGVILGFEDGLVDNALWEQKLGGLLDALDPVRPLRPIDALALIVPASLLLSAADAAAPDAVDAAEAVAKRGQRLYEIILMVQRRTGWRLPIQLIISGCDDGIPGFADWTRLGQAEKGFGPATHTPLVGWPSPFAIDTAYRPEWVDMAFKAMAETLSQQQFPLLMQPAAKGSATSLFLLPEKLERLRPGLATLLERMLQSSAYHEAFMFRGVYLTDGGEPPAPEVPPKTGAETTPKDGAAAEPTTSAGPAEPAEAPEAAAETASEPAISAVKEEPSAATDDAPSAAKAPPIAHRVFDTRVFAETGLAQPAHGEMTRRHRMVRRAQWGLAATVVAAAVGVIGVQYFIQEHLPPIEALLEGVDAHVRDAARVYPVQATARPRIAVAASAPAGRCATRPVAGARPPDKTLLQNSQQLLVLMARVDSDGVDTIWAPSSALDPLNGRVKAAVDIGYRITICNALLYKMATLDGINALLAPYRLDSPADETWLNVVANAGRFDRAYADLRKIRDQQLGSREAVASYRSAAGFALGFELPKSFDADYRLYGHGIADSSVPQFDDAGVREQFQAALKTRFIEALQAHYPCRPLAKAVQRIALRFETDPDAGVFEQEAAQASREGADARCPDIYREPAPSGPEAILRQFLADYATIAARGAIPGRYEWVYQPDVDTRAPRNQLPAVERLALVSDAFATDLARRSLDASHDAARALRAATLAGAPVLAEVDGRPQPSPALAKIRGYVDELLAQPFMAEIATGAGVDLPDGAVEWDLQQLQQAQRATEAFLNYAVPSAGVPRPVQDLVRPAATEHFVAYVEAALSTAARPAMGDGDADNAELAAFAQALPFLANLRDSLRQAQAPEAMRLANHLDAKVSRQAERLLRSAERRLNVRNVYALDPGGLRTWSGSDALAPQAFGVASPAELKADLAERRATVGVLARGDAQAVAAYLRSPGTLAESREAAALAARWEDLRLTLQAYEANRPGNALARLEEFIATDLDQLRLPGCRLSDPTAGRAATYFVDQVRTIRLQALARCGGGLEERYAGLADRFERDLARKFPFANANVSELADPNLVRDFFLTHGEELAAFRTALAAPERARLYGDSGREALRFIDRLIGAQRALAPMLGGGDEAPLAYRVGVAFFTDPSLAVGQGQVIEATIGAGASRAVSGGGDTFGWSNGQPIDVTLRWAADAPTVPSSSQRSPRVDGATARFRVEGDWALLRLIRAAEPTAAEAAGLPRGTSPIAFTVPLTSNLRKPVVGGDPPGLAHARVFLRLMVRPAAAAAPPAPQTISLQPFPDTAPALRRGGVAVGSSSRRGGGS